MADFDLALFKRQLAETIAWCNRQDLGQYGYHSLRTVITPSAEWIRSIFDNDREPYIQRLFEERRKLLHSQNIPFLPIGSDLEGGRLLAFFPDWSLFDGAAQAGSGQFFDHDNFPPWDTWVYYGSEKWPSGNPAKQTGDMNYLLSWVPPQLIK